MKNNTMFWHKLNSEIIYTFLKKIFQHSETAYLIHYADVFAMSKINILFFINIIHIYLVNILNHARKVINRNKENKESVGFLENELFIPLQFISNIHTFIEG